MFFILIRPSIHPLHTFTHPSSPGTCPTATARSLRRRPRSAASAWWANRICWTWAGRLAWWRMAMVDDHNVWVSKQVGNQANDTAQNDNNLQPTDWEGSQSQRAVTVKDRLHWDWGGEKKTRYRINSIRAVIDVPILVLWLDGHGATGPTRHSQSRSRVLSTMTLKNGAARTQLTSCGTLNKRDRGLNRTRTEQR